MPGIMRDAQAETQALRLRINSILLRARWAGGLQGDELERLTYVLALHLAWFDHYMTGSPIRVRQRVNLRVCLRDLCSMKYVSLDGQYSITLVV